MPIIEAQLKDSGGSVRAVSPVSPIPSVGSTASQSAAGGDTPADGGGSGNHDQAASAADFARAYAQILRIYADFSASDNSPPSLAEARSRVSALLPTPVVVIPLPPASADMVQQAVQAAKQVATQAALARAAQANINPGTVEQILATAS